MKGAASNLSGENDEKGPLRARSDLIDILSSDPKNTDALVTIIESELKGIKEGDVVDGISAAIANAADRAEIGSKARDNLLFWLTETSPDAKQMILVQTIEHLLQNLECRKPTLSALAKVSSEENVKLVLDWHERGILTLNQAVFVLLYPDSSTLG